MSDRREFVSATVAALTAARNARGRRRVSVEARTSVFYSHPNGEQTLVRFIVRDSDAPAGRMRVFDSGRRLLGTAGVIARGGGELYGELWFPLREELGVVSELELPGLRAPIRTPHTLRPQRRWSIHWVTIVDSDELMQRLAGLSILELGIQTALMADAAVGGNPHPLGNGPSELMDNLPFLRSAAGALELELRYGIPSSPIALARPETLRLGSTPIAMVGAGVPYAILIDDFSGRLFNVLQSRDGSRVITTSPVPGGEARALGFGADRDTMAQRVEDWLLASPTLQSPAYGLDTALVVSDTMEEDRATMALAVQEWNARFAYPSISIGSASSFFTLVERKVVRAAAPEPVVAIETVHPDSSRVEDAAATRRNDIHTRVEQMLAAVNEMLGASVPGVPGFASGFSAQFPGALVFNPSPTSRSDIVTMPDGSERVVTDIPALGYVYVPSVDPHETRPFLDPGDTAVSGMNLTVRLDPQTGAIASTYDRVAGREWVPPDGALNAVEGARLVRARRFRIPRVGSRLVVDRSTPFGDLETTITVYDDHTWIDIDNQLEDTPTGSVHFDLALDSPAVTWETPGGWEEREMPTGVIAHLRWLQLRGADGWRCFIRALDAPYASVRAAPFEDADRGNAAISSFGNARVESFAPKRSRYRIGFGDPFTSGDEAWFFGWGAEPFESAPVTGRGGTPLPSYGRVLRISIGALALGLKPADGGDGVVLYLQDIAGITRAVTVAPGILTFNRARIVDLVERNVGEELQVTENGTTVPVRAFGVAAVRLSGLALSGG